MREDQVESSSPASAHRWPISFAAARPGSFQLQVLADNLTCVAPCALSLGPGLQSVLVEVNEGRRFERFLEFPDRGADVRIDPADRRIAWAGIVGMLVGVGLAIAAGVTFKRETDFNGRNTQGGILAAAGGALLLGGAILVGVGFRRDRIEVVPLAPPAN